MNKRVTKNKRAAKPKKDVVDFHLFLKALNEAYPNTSIAPGVVCAWLPDRARWYASICRYEAGRKIVVAAAFSEHSVQDAVFQLAEKWKASMRPKTHAHLDNFLK